MNINEALSTSAWCIN